MQGQKTSSGIFIVDIIDSSFTDHEDLYFEIPQLNIQCRFDTYYFTIAMGSKSGTNEVRKEIVKLLIFWKNKIQELKSEDIIYLPIDFSDQYTGCLRVEKYRDDLILTYGYSMREGYTVSPTNPDDYYKSITDFKPDNHLLLKTNNIKMEQSLNEQIEKLLSK